MFLASAVSLRKDSQYFFCLWFRRGKWVLREGGALVLGWFLGLWGLDFVLSSNTGT